MIHFASKTCAVLSATCALTTLGCSGSSGGSGGSGDDSFVLGHSCKYDYICGQEEAAGSGASAYLDAMRDSCLENGGTLLDHCDLSSALGSCVGEQSGVTWRSRTTIYVSSYPHYFDDAEDVKKFCEGTGLAYKPL